MPEIFIGPVPYYQQEMEKYPTTIRAIATRVQSYFWEKLYPYETNPENLYNRFILADIGAGEEQAMRVAAFTSESTNPEFPFTAWNYGELEKRDDTLSRLDSNFNWFSPAVNAYVYARPMTLKMPMITFYSHPDDYYRAWSILMEANTRLTRLEVPITINGVDVTFPVDLKFEIAKGRYAHAFAEQLKVNNIYDIKHDVTIRYPDFIVEGLKVGLVEDIRLYGIEMNTGVRSLWAQNNNPLPNMVTSVANDSGNVSKVNPLTFTFNDTMLESSLGDINIWPNQDIKIEWDIDSKILTLSPVFEFLPSTKYEITFKQKTLCTFENREYVHYDSDYVFRFTTGA